MIHVYGLCGLVNGTEDPQESLSRPQAALVKSFEDLDKAAAYPKPMVALSAVD